MWPESEKGLNKLNKDIINNINPDIQFTSEHSKEELPFLDILIKKTVDKIETDIYYKPTDSKQYLLFNSCHPKHVAANISYNHARRICTIVDNTETRNIRLEELKTFLKNQNYPKGIFLYMCILHLVNPKTLNPWNATIMCAFVSTCELSTRFLKVFGCHFEKHQIIP